MLSDLKQQNNILEHTKHDINIANNIKGIVRVRYHMGMLCSIARVIGISYPLRVISCTDKLLCEVDAHRLYT